jgi:peptidoglycan/LPS O-acetylase OafA/YrhL
MGVKPRMSSTPGRFYSPELDGLRFVAALLVFVHHAPGLPYLGGVKEYGWLGVDLFLSLSAYLITRLAMLEQERTGGFALRLFFIRRALRIWPLYFLFALSACLASFLAGVTDGQTSARWALSHLSFSANILTAVTGYSTVSFSPHLWTISLEEQAYLVLALLLSVYFAKRASPRTAVKLGLALVGVLIVARIALLDAPHPFVWVTLLRADAFIFGALAALAGITSRWWTLPIGIALICSVALFPPIGSGQAYDIFGYTVLAAGCTMVILSVPKWLGVFRYFGKISYGIYVYHLAALWLASKLTGDLMWAFAIGLIAVLAISSLSYYILEAPFLRLKQRFTLVDSRKI